ncbi:uncharacterized protein LOC135168253 [Diachasmimorpha longicaudata]|uniref:uncharacterized protein LOC135168253 n=1 Tax=Diachasmimorpha longicaudata TaxID=58733 RepID=UPI0030B87096
MIEAGEHSTVRRTFRSVEMKAFGIFWGILLGSLWVMEINAECNYEGRKLKVGVHNITCGTLTCHEDGTMSAVGCGDEACAPGKQIGYKPQDDSKVFPECCARPICAE